jgi:nucleotide-binding universal stress UspA family protein
MALVNRILIATDFSAHSERALEYAAGMAVQFQAKLLIAHVYYPPVVAVPDAVIPMSAADMKQFLDKLYAGLDAAAAAARKLGATDVETALIVGEPWHEIVKTAHDRRSDLVVVGTHGRGAVAHFFLGSVAEKVVRKAACPVLVVGKPH